jgi:tachykinin receptor 3
MFVVIVTIFAVCWLPYHLFFIYSYHNISMTSTSYVQHLYLGFYFLAMANSSVNPCIYYYMNERWAKLMLQAHSQSRVCVSNLSFFSANVWLFNPLFLPFSLCRFRIYFQQIICCCCRLKSWKSHTKTGSPQGILLGKHSHSEMLQGKSRLCQ